MEIQRIDFYVRIDPNSKRSQGGVTSSILKKKQISFQCVIEPKLRKPNIASVV